jgi:DNA-binding MarR family transcriptional regulator
MREASESGRELILLEEIERDPDTTQATLAGKLGVAVGTVNWHLRRLIDKGYVKVKRAERRKLRYIITPDGIALRARLTVTYVGSSLALYRETRAGAKQALQEARRRGFRAVGVAGDGELAEICRLTCLEQGFSIAEDDSSPVFLEVEGRTVLLRISEPREGSSVPAARPGTAG